MLIEVLLVVHLLGLGIGFGSGFAHGQIAGKIVNTNENQTASLWEFERLLSWLIIVGTAVMIVTGLLMLWLKFGGFVGMSWWFWLKMAMVVVVAIGTTIEMRSACAWQAGDKSAAVLTEHAGMLTGVAATIVVVAAVFSFN
jgi:protoporphyrinogen IX oxidase